MFLWWQCCFFCLCYKGFFFIPPAPCLPINVTATKNCGQNIVEVSWQASPGAKNYSAAAIDGNGHRLECVSNGTSCRLNGVVCGRNYSVTVAAVDDVCTSKRSSAVQLLSGKDKQKVQFGAFDMFCLSPILLCRTVLSL